MAIYQFVIELVPADWVKDRKNCVSELYDGDLYDLTSAWKGYQLNIDIVPLLSKALSKSKSWSESLSVWGDDEYSDIQLRLEGGCVESIRYRLDLRGDVEKLKLQLIDLASSLKCQLFFPQLKKIIDPNLNFLNEVILRSNSFKFTENPQKFLDEMSS